MARRGKSRNTKSRSSRVTRTPRSNRRLRSPSIDNSLLNLILSPTKQAIAPSFGSSARSKNKTKKREIIYISGEDAPTRSRRKTYSSFSTPVYSLNNPLSVCIRRKQRKEVLHALGKTGQSGQNAPRYTQNSSTHCKG